MKSGWWLAIAVAAGVATGIAWPPPPIPRAQKVSDSTQTLPTAESLRRLPPEAVAQVSQGLRWPGEGSGTGEASAEGPWKLAGIIRDPATAALVQLATGKIERFEAGSTLPDGSTVTRVGSDEVTIERDGCARSYRLHHPPPAENGGCIATQ